MKRLLYYLNHISGDNTTTFRYTVMEDGRWVQKEIYDGECIIPHGERIGIRREPTYWQDDISYKFERTNRMALDRPTITIAIPAERLKIYNFTPACADFCLRNIKPYFDNINEEYANKSRPDRENGKFYVYTPGSEVLVRNAAHFTMCPAKDYENGCGAVIYDDRFSVPPSNRMCLCVRIEIQLPHGNLKRAKNTCTCHAWTEK